MRGDRILRSRLRERVVLTLKSGAAFAGILYSCDARSLVLREAAAVGVAERGTGLPPDGEVIVLMPDVAYIQRP